jgi:tripartite-type tricarboxylate transporter receptor subunit TctC
MFPTAGAGTPHVKSGKLRALAVTSAEPSALVPGLPTVASSGLPGYETEAIAGIFVPAKTPVNAVDRLNLEIVRFITKPETRERFFNTGVEVVGSSPSLLAVKVKSEIIKMGKLIKDINIRPE